MKKSVPVGGVCMPMFDLSHLPKKVQLRAPLSPLQTAWTGLQARPQGTDSTSLDGVECTAHHSGSRGVADIVSITMPLLSIKDLAVAISTRAGPAEDDPPLYK